MEHYIITRIDFLITCLKSVINKDYCSKIEIFLFGSANQSKEHNDIDLLIVYDQNTVNIQKILRLRQRVAKKLEITYNIQIDICLLSKKENEEIKFNEIEKGTKLLLTPYKINC
jgi:predicted nucleotidyltransferase